MINNLLIGLISTSTSSPSRWSRSIMPLYWQTLFKSSSVESLLSSWGETSRPEIPMQGGCPNASLYGMSLNVEWCWVLYCHWMILHPTAHQTVQESLIHAPSFCCTVWLILSTPPLDSECLGDPLTILQSGHNCFNSAITWPRKAGSRPMWWRCSLGCHCCTTEFMAIIRLKNHQRSIYHKDLKQSICNTRGLLSVL